ncbi:MAG: biotin/lipoyl-binding protein, partial [Acidobacteriota bacterium]
MKRAIRLSLALCLSVGIGGGCQPAPEDSQARPAEAASPAGAAITALGRLEPGLGVIELAAPAGDRIVSLEVREGEEVSAGQVLVVLESRRVRRAELELSQAARAEAEAHLRRARRVGPATVAAHEASVERLRAELRLSTRDLERTRGLVDVEVLPPREL